jgi:hypothetical protein
MASCGVAGLVFGHRTLWCGREMKLTLHDTEGTPENPMSKEYFLSEFRKYATEAWSYPKLPEKVLLWLRGIYLNRLDEIVSGNLDDLGISSLMYYEFCEQFGLSKFELIDKAIVDQYYSARNTAFFAAMGQVKGRNDFDYWLQISTVKGRGCRRCFAVANKNPYSFSRASIVKSIHRGCSCLWVASHKAG